MRPALFLDRDGVVDEPVWYEDSREWEAPRTAADLRMIEGAAEALRRARDAGWPIFLVTNQPSWAKGKTTREDLLAVQAEVERALGGVVTKSYLCFHHPEASLDALRVRCDCRKPGTRSLLDAAAEFGIDLGHSWMVGDRDTDLESGRAAGCRVALIEHPTSADRRHGAPADFVGPDLATFIDHLLEEPE